MQPLPAEIEVKLVLQMLCDFGNGDDSEVELCFVLCTGLFVVFGDWVNRFRNISCGLNAR
jgi:hypothetical protein